MAREPPAEHRADYESRERHHGCRHVHTGVRREPESEENHVPGHVRHEDVAQHQHAHRIEETGGERQQQQGNGGEFVGHRGGDGHLPSIACPMSAPDLLAIVHG
jgi:hypothetical protein